MPLPVENVHINQELKVSELLLANPRRWNLSALNELFDTDIVAYILNIRLG